MCTQETLLPQINLQEASNHHVDFHHLHCSNNNVFQNLPNLSTNSNQWYSDKRRTASYWQIPLSSSLSRILCWLHICTLTNVLHKLLEVAWTRYFELSCGAHTAWVQPWQCYIPRRITSDLTWTDDSLTWRDDLTCKDCSLTWQDDLTCKCGNAYTSKLSLIIDCQFFTSNLKAIIMYIFAMTRAGRLRGYPVLAHTPPPNLRKGEGGFTVPLTGCL